MGGAPVPFISVTPRMINCAQGPSPSLRPGAFGICANEYAWINTEANKKNIFFMTVLLSMEFTAIFTIHVQSHLLLL
jgi:hypothetical protein